MLLATALVTASLAGCAETPDPTGPTGAGGKADGTLTTVSFDGDWGESADGPLVAGLPIRIEYDLDRVTECRGSTNGSEVWGVTGHASFDGGAETTFGVTRLVDGRVVPLTPELEIPAGATSVQLWFTTSNRWGCNAYDSNDGANYAFDIEPRAGAAIISFDADFSETLSGELRAGDQLVIHYAPERLAECAGSTGGNAAWSITGYWQVDGGPVKMVLVTRAQGPDLVAADPEITVPRGSDLALWFDATSRFGCHAYDSNLGGNYHLTID